MRHKMKSSSSGLVYSTEHGTVCPRCSKPKGSCICQPASFQSSSPRPAKDTIVRVGRQTKGRKGKGVTLITGVPLLGDELVKLGSRLKKLCGSGGTIKNGVIEIQGDHRDLLVDELQRQGWQAKKAGG